MFKTNSYSRCLFFLLIFIVLHTHISAQSNQFLVFFKDKQGTLYSKDAPASYLTQRAIDRRNRQGIEISERDLPVSQSYIDSLQGAGAKVVYTTKWLNGALVEFTTTEAALVIEDFSFIKEHDYNLGTLSYNEYELYPKENVNQILTGRDSIDYGNSFNQLDMLGIPNMHLSGYRGEGIRIAVIDGGFRNADQLAAFDSLQINQKLIATYDFVEKETNVFDDHDHGTKVFSVIGSNLPGQLVGPAFESEFVLLRSEEVANESRLEEFYWLLAAEYADSIGVDIINSSLGYNIFDDIKDDYKKEDLDGGTALITIAADLAAATGMLVVTSGGNEGNDSWGTITPPADADSVLTVGGVNSLQVYAGFSSIGPTADGRTKPDIAAQATSVTVSNSSGTITFSSGTSFAAPLITGLAAGIWQANPNLTNMQLIDTIKSIASQSNATDNQLGFGVPDFRKLDPVVTSIGKENNFDFTLYPNPANNSFEIILPKKLEGEPLNISLFDTSGKVIYESDFKVTSGSIKIDQALSKGLLIVKITSRMGSAFKKIISY